MMSRTAFAIVLGVSLIAWQPANAAGNNCAVAFTPKLSGFPLNPVLDQLTVASAKPKTSKDVCVLEPGDQIIRVNEQKVVGSRALAVQRYWKALKPDTSIILHVRRAGSVLTLTSK